MSPTLPPSPDSGHATEIPTAQLRPFERAARLLHYRSPKRAKDESYEIPIKIMKYRLAFRDDVGLLGRFTETCQAALRDPLEPGESLKALLARKGREDGEEDAAMARLFADESPEAEDALMRELEQEMGAASQLYELLKARKAARL